MTGPNPDLGRLGEQYARFAELEARGRSPLYETLARAVSTDDDTRRFLALLPRGKQQPNLLFAAVRHLFGTQPDWPDFRACLLDNADTVRGFMLTHATQTNEPARCATLLPVLARLPQPIALIEVGASAGLCLLPDLYGYDYGPHAVRPPGSGDFPVFECDAGNRTPLPSVIPDITWRAGLDLNPIDAADAEQARWLETLVWPEQASRLANLRLALKLAAAHRPRIDQGDLLGDGLANLVRAAPDHATVVVFHTAVLAYVADPAARIAFADRVRSLCPYWICNEARRVYPEIDRTAGPADQPGRFLLSVNGSPVAWTDPHGAGMRWIA